MVFFLIFFFLLLLLLLFFVCLFVFFFVFFLFFFCFFFDVVVVVVVGVFFFVFLGVCFRPMFPQYKLLLLIILNKYCLTFTTLLANSVDDKLMIFLFYLEKNEKKCMKCQILFPEKRKSMFQNVVCYNFYKVRLSSRRIRNYQNNIYRYEKGPNP